jgi:hypothetical protein
MAGEQEPDEIQRLEVQQQEYIERCPRDLEILEPMNAFEAVLKSGTLKEHFIQEKFKVRKKTRFTSFLL